MTTIYVLLSVLSFISLYLLTGLVAMLLVDYTNVPDWVEGIAVVLLQPWDFKNWLNWYREDEENEIGA